jgi:predicted Zn finger-like uncharacterized protein
MKIQCPKCKAGYNIDISKLPAIPEGGISVTCPKCKNKIPVSLSGQAQPQSQQKAKESEPSSIIPCPECGHVNVASKTCVSCGKVFTKEELNSLSISIGN